MNETQDLKFSDELANKIKGAFATPEFLKSMKDLQDGVDAGDTGTFKMTKGVTPKKKPFKRVKTYRA